MHILIIAAVLILIIGTLAGLEMYREYHTFQVTRYIASPECLNGMKGKIKIVFLSDMHNREYGRKNERLYQAVLEEEPDLILIGGDMIVEHPDKSLAPALSFVKRLTDLCPVYYAIGNHEQRMKEMPENYKTSFAEYQRELQKQGVIFLENEARTVKIKGAFLVLNGLELPLITYKKFQKAKVTAGDVASRLGCRPKKSRTEYTCQVLLAHNPTYMDAYKEWGADLILCGHLHGGMVRIPGIGGVITPQAFLFPKYSGEMRKEDGKVIIVSKGVGSHSVNIRLFNIPEVVSIELKG